MTKEDESFIKKEPSIWSGINIYSNSRWEKKMSSPVDFGPFYLPEKTLE